MSMTRRQLLSALPLLMAGSAFAQSAAGRTLRIIVPFPPGQGADLIMRIVAERLGQRRNQPVIIDNRAGAGGAIGSEFASKQAPDGLTLVMGASGPMSIAPTLQPQAVHYNPVKDFEPVTGVASVAQVFVVAANSPIKSLRELITQAKAAPGKLSYGSSGNGTTQHLFVENFTSMAGIRLLHVPYKGSSPAFTDLIGGQINLMSDTIPAMIQYIKAGTVRALGVTSATRSPFLPDVPTIAEQGLPGYAAEGWITLLAPVGLPASIADRLDQDIRAVLAEPELRQKLKEMGYVEMSQSREALRTFIGNEIAKWKKVIDTAGITAG